MHSQALVNGIVLDFGNTRTSNLVSYIVGISLLAVLSQLAFPLPWTPVPITGQTFGVTLIALLWGKKRAFAIVASYLILGLFSLPVFAVAGAATYGYLGGMLMASALVGHLSDKGWTQSFFKSWLAGFMGSCLVFSCGLLWLSFFVPTDALLTAGLLPFLPGDLIKTVSAAAIASQLTKKSFLRKK